MDDVLYSGRQADRTVLLERHQSPPATLQAINATPVLAAVSSEATTGVRSEKASRERVRVAKYRRQTPPVAPAARVVPSEDIAHYPGDAEEEEHHANAYLPETRELAQECSYVREHHHAAPEPGRAVRLRVTKTEGFPTTPKRSQRLTRGGFSRAGRNALMQSNATVPRTPISTNAARQLK